MKPNPTTEPFESLDAWQVAHGLALHIYRTTGAFPAAERFGLTAQLRRAAVAIPANLAEGKARNAPREFVYFCRMAKGSLAEVCTLLCLARDLDMISHQGFEECMEGYDRVGKMLHFLMVFLKKQQK